MLVWKISDVNFIASVTKDFKFVTDFDTIY